MLSLPPTLLWHDCVFRRADEVPGCTWAEGSPSLHLLPPLRSLHCHHLLLRPSASPGYEWRMSTAHWSNNHYSRKIIFIIGPSGSGLSPNPSSPGPSPSQLSFKWLAITKKCIYTCILICNDFVRHTSTSNEQHCLRTGGVYKQKPNNLVRTQWFNRCGNYIVWWIREDWEACSQLGSHSSMIRAFFSSLITILRSSCRPGYIITVTYLA